MVFLFHKNNKVVKITKDNYTIPIENNSIGATLFLIANTYENEQIVWCHSDLERYLNINFITSQQFNSFSIHSFNPYQNNFLNSKLGYIDHNSILKVNKKVTFQTWQMNESVGLISTLLLRKLEKYIDVNENFNYLLNSITKRTFMNGVLCYSEPNLFQNLNIEKLEACSNATLFQFVKQHYKIQWLFVLFLNVLLYERKILVLPFIKALFYAKKQNIQVDFISEIFVEKKPVSNISIDVIIPTIGRETYLKDFLNDLKQQQVWPTTVIIVEQNPDEKAISKLEYITNETWPFKIIHQFIHQTGACNARNLALQKVTSDWVFFADDDIRIETDFLKQAFDKIQNLNANAILFSCLLKNQNTTFLIPHQTSVFGSGCTIVNSKFALQVTFDTKYEFCFGEDSDYGMQLRNLGADVIYLPEPKILHLKAPIGGFRTQPTYLWTNEVVFPKPAPTILLNLLRYTTEEQQKGFKFLFFIKSLIWKNPIHSFKVIKKHWNSSMFWANKLENM